MSGFRLRFALTVAILLTSASAYAADAPAAACSAPNVGLQILTFGTMNLAVWYPTAATESPYPYYSTLSGSVALNGAVSTCGKYPLILFSHGFGGCGMQSVFFTEQLARNGFIVAAPDHADAGCSVTSTGGASPPVTLTGSTPPFTNPAAWNNQSYLNRYVDNENTINGMLAQAQIGPQIDVTRIAMSGHSLGGYDTFAMIGGWSTWLDPRIKAGLMLSPFIQPFMAQTPSTVPNPHVPQMYQGGTADIGITPFIMQAGGQYDQAQTPKIFLELQGAGHLDFSNKVCSTVTTVQACLATIPNAASIDQYAIDFLNFYLNGQSVSALWGQGTGLAAYWRNVPSSAVSSASYLPSGQLAPNEISALFGQGMSYATTVPPAPTVPTSLGGTTVTLTDSVGTVRPCSLFFASPQQLNFLIPPGTAGGVASITVSINGSMVASGQITVAAMAPSLYTINGSGAGQAAAYTQTSAGYSLPYNPATLAPLAVNVSSGGVYMVMAGTGLSLANASIAQATIGSTAVPVSSIVPYPPYPGLDAVVLGPLPASLAGAGTQTISLTVGGLAANPVTVVIQ